MVDASAASAAPPPISKDEVLYRAVLDRWRRCHLEGGIVASALREAEAQLALRRHQAATGALGRILAARRARALQAALHAWALGCALAAEVLIAQRGAAQLRESRAALKEVEAQLISAHEAERVVRAQWAEDRQSWQKQQLDELALVASLRDGPAGDTSTAPPPPPPPLPPPPPPRPTSPSPASVRAPESTAAASASAPAVATPRSAFGARAEALLAAWNREAGASRAG